MAPAGMEEITRKFARYMRKPLGQVICSVIILHQPLTNFYHCLTAYEWISCLYCRAFFKIWHAGLFCHWFISKKVAFTADLGNVQLCRNRWKTAELGAPYLPCGYEHHENPTQHKRRSCEGKPKSIETKQFECKYIC